MVAPPCRPALERLSLLLQAAAFMCLGARGAELHPGHPAIHQTALWRQPKRTHKATSRGEMVQVAADGKAVQQHGFVAPNQSMEIATKLEDMTSEYIGTIGVGTAEDGGSQFEARVVFDTGSTNLWVASVLCHTYPCPAESENKFYDPKKSITQEAFTGTGLTRDPGADIDIMFGTGELRGPLHVDTYRVGPLKVKKQPFAMIREMNGEVFSAFPFEGILGLAFKSLSFGGIEPFFERVIQQKLLEHNEFAFYLNVDSQKPSALLWGGIDQSLYDGPLRMFPVVQAHYWALELVDLRLGKKSLLASSGGERIRRVIVDSGTTYFTAPSELYDRVMDSVPRAPCSEVEHYKPLTYVLRGADGKTYDLKVTQETYMVGAEGGDECRPSFMRLDINNKYGPALILGEVFMRHFFTVFSRGDGSEDQAKIGFARAKLGVVPQVKDGKKPSFLQQEAEVSATGEVSGVKSGRFIRRERL